MPECKTSLKLKTQALVVKDLGIQDYATVLNKMKAFSANRNSDTIDELWICEHHPVFTQGRHGKAEHVLNPHNIPIIQTDRGGQVTYHGPGQLIFYFLLDIKRRKLGVKGLVKFMEASCIDTLKELGIEALSICGAPGIYVNNKKIASLGLRVSRGKTYHGLSLNVDMDLKPFSYINPCGYKNLQLTQIKDYLAQPDSLAIKHGFVAHFSKYFNYQIDFQDTI